MLTKVSTRANLAPAAPSQNWPGVTGVRRNTVMMRKLDYSMLPSIKSMNLFSKFEDGVEGVLTENQPLPEVYERARASLMFFRSVNDDNENWLNSAYIRAGLNEFYSLGPVDLCCS